MLHCHYLMSLCQRRHWPEPRYTVSPIGKGYECVVRVNNREYRTVDIKDSEESAREAAALIAFMICRNFSANDGMYPTGFAHGGKIQGNPVPVGSGRRNNRDSNSSEEAYYASDSQGSRSGGSSPDFSTRRHAPAPARAGRHHDDHRPAAPRHGRHEPQQDRHYRLGYARRLI